MPIFDLECQKCQTMLHNFLQVRSDDKPVCPTCGGTEFNKIFDMMPHIRMTGVNTGPDPSPPLEELRGKGTEGYKDKPYADTNLNNYERTRDKYGNAIWTEKRRQYFGAGGARRSSAERNS